MVRKYCGSCSSSSGDTQLKRNALGEPKPFTQGRVRAIYEHRTRLNGERPLEPDSPRLRHPLERRLHPRSQLFDEGPGRMLEFIRAASCER
jgi:hypothetical protein